MKCHVAIMAVGIIGYTVGQGRSNNIKRLQEINALAY